jgi:hypothetical protein
MVLPYISPGPQSQPRVKPSLSHVSKSVHGVTLCVGVYAQMLHTTSNLHTDQHFVVNHSSSNHTTRLWDCQ